MLYLFILWIIFRLFLQYIYIYILYKVYFIYDYFRLFLLTLPGRTCSVVHYLHPSFNHSSPSSFHLSLADRYHPAVDLCTSSLGVHVNGYHAVVARVSGRSLLHLRFSSSDRRTSAFACVLTR